MVSVFTLLQAELDAASIPYHGVSLAGVTYKATATAQQIIDGNLIFSNFDFEAAEDAVAQELIDTMNDTEALKDHIDDLLADAASGKTAITADLATVASGKSALPNATLAQVRNIVDGMLDLMTRHLNRETKIIDAIEKHYRYEKHLLG